MAVNKVIYGGNILIDLTTDTVTADKLASGITAHDKSGKTITGTNTYDADTQDATAAAAEILSGKNRLCTWIQSYGYDGQQWRRYRYDFD